MSTQPEALRLADELRAAPERSRTSFEAAAELRRLHAVNAELTENLEKKSVAIQRIWKERDELRKINAELLEALKEVYDWCYPTDSAWANKARAAIAKVEEQK